jgi:hypothetical protein
MSSFPALPPPGADKAPAAQPPLRYWTKARIACAQYVAEGELTLPQISARIGKSPKWIKECKTNPWFRERVAEIRKVLMDDALTYGLANQRLRLQVQTDRWERLRQVIEARAEALRGKAPGAETGLLTEQIIASRDEFWTVYEVDPVVLAELRKLEAQIAQELGQVAGKASAGDVNINGEQVLVKVVYEGDGVTEV